MTSCYSQSKIYVIPYSVPDTPEARQEGVRTGNCIITHAHGSGLPLYRPLGMRMYTDEKGNWVWEDWDGRADEPS